MSFFSTVKATFWDPAFYRAKAAETKGAFAYYFKLALLLSVVLTIVFAAFMGPRIHRVLNALPGEIVAYYPDDLEVTFDRGAVSTNKPQPYALPFPEKLRSADEEEGPANLIVFDTAAPFSVEAYKAYDTAVLVTRDAFVMKDENGGIRVTPLSDLNCTEGDACTYTLTNDKLAEFMAGAAPLIKYVLPILAVGTLLLLMLLYVLGLLALLVPALLSYLIVRIAPRMPRLSYGQIYRLCLYATTPAILITTLCSILNTVAGVHVAYLGGFWFELVVTTAVLVFNLRAAHSGTSDATTAA